MVFIMNINPITTDVSKGWGESPSIQQKIKVAELQMLCVNVRSHNQCTPTGNR
jgi:hypothetical protein